MPSYTNILVRKLPPTEFAKTASHWSRDHRAFTHIDAWQIYKLVVRTGITRCLGWIAATEEVNVEADWTVDAPLTPHKALGSGLLWKRRESTFTSPNWFHMLATTIRFNFPHQEEDKHFPVPHRAGPQETCCDWTFTLWQTAGWPNVSETNGLSAARLYTEAESWPKWGPVNWRQRKLALRFYLLHGQDLNISLWKHDNI